MTDTELRRLSALRSLLEGFAARQTAAHPERTARQPERLRAILQRLRTAVRRRDYPTFRTADEELHATVVAAAGPARWRCMTRRATQQRVSAHVAMATTTTTVVLVVAWVATTTTTTTTVTMRRMSTGT